MKTTTTLFALLLLLSVPTMAQENSKLHFIVHGGVSTPESPNDFETGWKDGSNIGAGVGYRFSPHLSVQGLVNYDSFSFDGERLLSGLDLDLPPGVDVHVSGAEASVLSLSGELKALFIGNPNRVSPYVTIGVGVADVEVSDTTITTSIFGFELTETLKGHSETTAMASVGAGLDIPLGERFGVFVEGRYQSNFTDEDTTDSSSVRAGIRVAR